VKIGCPVLRDYSIREHFLCILFERPQIFCPYHRTSTSHTNTSKKKRSKLQPLPHEPCKPCQTKNKNVTLCGNKLLYFYRSSNHRPQPSCLPLSAPAPPAYFFSSSSHFSLSTLDLARNARANFQASVSAKFQASIALLNFSSSVVLFSPNSIARLNSAFSFSASSGFGLVFRLHNPQECHRYR